MTQFALVGCGRIARRHAENIAKVGVLKAVCDVVPSKADVLAEQYSATAYYSIDELLQEEKEITVVSICSPNGFHAEHAIKSLQARKHVLCEKPLCISSVAARQMVDTAYFFKRRLFVVMQNRYNPGVQVLKRLLDENKLGRLYSFQINCFWNRPQEYYTGDWKGTQDLDGGILYTQFSHFIDLLYWLLGDVTAVKAYGSNYGKRKNFELEDTGVAILQLQNGMIGNLSFTINSYKQNREGSIAIFGESGSVKIGGQYLNEIEWFEVEGEDKPVIKNNPANNYGFYEGSMSNHPLVYEQLIESLNGRESTMVEASEAIKVIQIIERIYKAAEVITES